MPAPNWKEPRRAIDKRELRRQKTATDHQARRAVRIRDQYCCRVCGRHTNVVHEHRRRGAGGEISLQNSFCACDVIDGGVCHPLLQMRWITPVMPEGAEMFDANANLTFEMSPATATRVFDRRPRTPQVRIVEDAR